MTAYTVNQIGDYVGIVALAILVYAKTRDALAVTALYVAMQFLPALLSPLLTARLDRHDLRRTLSVVYLLEGLLFAALAVVAAEAFSLPAVLVLVLFDGVLMLTARGLLRGAVNHVLEPPGLLRQGNGLINVGFAAGFVGGAALGGALVGWFDEAVALWIDAASFVACGLLLATSRGLKNAHADDLGFRARLAGGLRYAREHASIRLLLVGEGIAIVLFTIIVPIEVIYAKDTLGAGDAGYGLLVASWGAGVVVGSGVFLGATRRSPHALVLVSTLAVALAYFGMGSVRELWMACALSIIGGTGNGVQWVSVMTALQEATPGELQARITGLLEAVASAASGIGFVLGGILTSLTSPPVAFHTSGAAIFVLTAVIVAAAARERRLRPRPRPAAPSGGA